MRVPSFARRSRFGVRIALLDSAHCGADHRAQGSHPGLTMTLSHFLWQTWRSIVSFFLSFFVLGLMVWFTPEWVQGFIQAAGNLKYFIMGAADETLGYGQPSALFAILVGDTAIALALMTLFTRVIVLTLILWVGGLIYRSLFGGGQSAS